MKNNIMDAVNGFKAEWPTGSFFMVCDKSNEPVGMGYGQGQTVKCDDPLICGEHEFNNLVNALSTNFGESVDYVEYKRRLEGERVHNVSCDNALKVLSMVDAPSSDQPLFTQSMADNKYIPVIGVECEFKHDQWFGNDCKPCTVLAITNEYFILKEANCLHEQHYYKGDISFKPIDSRTDKEKAVTDLINESIGGHKTRGIDLDAMVYLFGLAYDKWGAS